MSQSQHFHVVWEHERDHARPVVPDDVGQLAVVRTFQPPSKAHRARLARVRPDVTPARPVQPCDRSAYARINDLIRLRDETRRQLKHLSERTPS